jgi:hypothetical protein
MSKPPPAFWQDPEGDGEEIAPPTEPEGAADDEHRTGGDTDAADPDGADAGEGATSR